jgi:N-acetylglutamate synthase-like GNAT family acetyltransferase
MTARAEAWPLRLASENDVPALEELITLSARVLQAQYYNTAQLDRAIGSVFGVDRQLIRDATYFVAEEAGRIIGCGGWSRRHTLHGSDRHRVGEDPPLDPVVDAARIRAFFVHPEWSRRGIASSILARCETELQMAGFRRAEIVATLAGQPLYAAFGYRSDQRLALPLEDGLTIEGVKMSKDFGVGC